MKRLSIAATLVTLVLFSTVVIAGVVTPYPGQQLRFDISPAGFDEGVRATAFVGLGQGGVQAKANQYLAIRLDAVVKDGTKYAVTCNRTGRSELIGMVTMSMESGALILQSRDGQSPLFPIVEGLMIEVWNGNREKLMEARVPRAQ